jgi:hypothetical protein
MKHRNNHYGQSMAYGKLAMNLQLHAEEGEDESEEEDEEEQEEGGEGVGEKKKERTYTKKELGAIVKKEVAKALKKQKEELSEVEKLESMTEEQKKSHKQKQKDDEVAELRRKVVRMEMSKTTSKALREAGVDPTDEVLDFVLGEDADSTASNIEKFVEIKDAIVLAAEKGRNTGRTPKVITGARKSVTKTDFEKMTYQERVALKKKDPEGYKQLQEE